MKALSVRQPWATLIVCGRKRIETRTRPTRHRGPLLIHAAASTDADVLGRDHPLRPLIEAALGRVLPWRRTELYRVLPFGCLIGAVDVEGCVPVDRLGGREYHPRHPLDELRRPPEFGEDDPRWLIGWSERALGDYSAGRHAWLLARPRRARRHVPLRGHQGLFKAPKIELGSGPS